MRLVTYRLVPREEKEEEEEEEEKKKKNIDYCVLSKNKNVIYILGLADMAVTAEHIREKLTKDLGAVHVVHLR